MSTNAVATLETAAEPATVRVYIGFSRPRGRRFPLYSWAIRAVQGTPYSHTYVRWHLPAVDQTVVYQASSLFVNFMSEAIFRAEAEVVEEFAFEIDRGTTYRELLRFCIANAGAPYGWREALGMTVVMLGRRLGRKWGNPFADGKKTQVCSELVGYILRDVFKEKLTLDLDTAGPREIHDFIVQSKKPA